MPIEYVVHFEHWVLPVLALDGFVAVEIAKRLAPVSGEWGAVLCAHRQ